MANPILVTGAARLLGGIGRTVTDLLLKQGKAARAMVRNEDERAQALLVSTKIGPPHAPELCHSFDEE